MRVFAECGGNQSEAAKRLGIARQTLQNTIHQADGHVVKGVSILTDRHGEETGRWTKTRLRGREEAETVQLPDPKKIVKRSTLYDQEGRVTQQWIAEKPEDAERERLWQAFADGLAADLPRLQPIKAPAVADNDLLVGYPVADLHLGMLSWAPETGADYDLEIGERLLTGAMQYLVGRAPAASRALVAFLGDVMHYDSFEAVTPRSRHLLDADSRYPKMVATTIRTMRAAIDIALCKHAAVDVVIEIGNHDLSSAIFLAQAFSALYENEPRVRIDTSPAQFHYYRFGRCLIGTHHGHSVKMDNLPGVMARDRAQDWGETLHRQWWTGHIHHAKSAKTVPNFADGAGCSVESFRILPPVDAHAANMGYRAPRDMKAIVLHRDLGEMSRITANPAMFKEHAA